MRSKVIFNSLPPDSILNPSAAFPILKSFLQHNNINSEIIYWNILLGKEFTVKKTDIEREAALVALLPYYYIIAKEYDDTKALNRIITFYKKLNIPNSFIDGFRRETLDNISSNILDKITLEVEKAEFANVLLWGLTGKCYQWIPGFVLSNVIKKKHESTKIVIGGFPDKDSAIEVLNTCKNIDFAIYGEGEYPLLELYNSLNNGSEELSKVPRLIYREDNKVKIAEPTQSQFLDFQHYIYPDNTDYIKSASTESQEYYLRLPINSIRSCNWNKCNFCGYGAGYKYRERAPEDIVREVEYLSEKFDITEFNFVDNDIIGRDIKRFEALLDLLISSGIKNGRQYSFWAQIILRKELDATLYKKMVFAGFKFLFAGYESVSDSLLAKMNKINRFAHNIHYLKFCTKFGVPGSVNIIKGIPDETPDEVDESCRNLHFLRFFYHGNAYALSHRIGWFGLCKTARYNKTLPNELREKFAPDAFCFYLPESFVKTPFNVFYFDWVEHPNTEEWENFTEMEDYYKKHNYRYRISKQGDTLFYREFLDEEEIQSFVFNEPEYFEVMNLANDKVISFEELSIKLASSFQQITAERIKDIISDLKNKRIMYASDDYSTIITIVDMAQTR